MVKHNKFLVYKKYNDEIWGLLVRNKKYSYTKKRVLLNYKEYIRKLKSRIKVKYKRFRIFLFNYFSFFYYKVFCKRIFLFRFLQKYFNYKFLSEKYNKSLCLLFKESFVINEFVVKRTFQSSKNLVAYSSFRLFKSIARNVIDFLQNDIILCDVIKPSLNVVFNSNLVFKCLSYQLPLIVSFYKNVFVFGRFRYLVRKRLQLQRRKEFFYCVHIAAPKKKKSKPSLFGLKNIYYKKLSLFFGFFNVDRLFKLYDRVQKLRFDSERSFFMLLESRLEIFLLRTNIFPSLYFIKRFILNGNVFVNENKISFSSYMLKPSNIIMLNKKFFKFFYFNLKYFLLRKFLFLNYPKYMEFDYKLFCGMLVRKPSYVELTRPFSFDLYTSFLTFHK